MPDNLSEADIERILAARREGKLPSQIAQDFTPTAPPANEGLTPEQLQQLAQERSGLTGNSTPPGAEPEGPVSEAMMDAGFAAQGGARTRPSQGFGPKARDAAFDVLFERARKGDPQAVFRQPGEDWRTAPERWRNSQ